MGLDGVELVMAIEERFGIVISDGDAEKIATVGQMHRHIVDALRQRGEMVDEEQVWKVLRTIVVQQLSVRPEQLQPETRWIEDLGIG
jgi:acyl carrier protein